MVEQNRGNGGIRLGEPHQDDAVEAVARLRTLLRDLDSSLDGAGEAELPGALQFGQECIEQVEALLRHLDAVAQEDTGLGDERKGFYLDAAERVWLRYTDLIGEIATVFGMRGSGKSNSVAVILEHLLRHGLPLSVIDLHGEYYSLRALPVPLLVVGIAGGAATAPDLLVEPASVASVAEFSVRQRVSIVLDLSGLRKRDRYEALANYFDALWSVCAAERHPYHLVLEEAHGYIPQQGSSPVEGVVSDLSTEYRKFGVGMLIIDQRPANVKKTPLTQARVRILHEVDHPLDVERYREFVPKRYARGMEETLSSFVPGSALVKVHRRVHLVQVRQRETVHVGITPTLEGRQAPVEIARDDHLVQQLRGALTASAGNAHPSLSGNAQPHGELQGQLAALQAQNQGLVQENRSLRERVELLNAAPATREGIHEQVAGALPDRLEIAQATVQTMHVGETEGPAAHRLTHAPPSEVEQELARLRTKLRETEQELARLRDVQRSRPVPATPPRRDVIETLSEQERFDWRLLVQGFVGLRGTAREVTKILFTYEGRDLTATDLAAMLRKSAATINANIPRELIERGLITWHKRGNARVYTGALLSYLRSAFRGREGALRAHLFVLL